MTDLKSSFPSDPDVLAVFREELARASKRTDVLDSGPTLWPRFAGYYQGLSRLPRRLKTLGILVFALAILGLGSQAQAIDADDLAMAVTVSSDPVVPGGVVLYQLTATNRGTIPTSGGVTMTAFVPGDTSGAGVTDGGDCPGAFCNTGEAVTWSLSDLPAGASRTVGLSVQVFGGSSAPPDGALIGQQAAVTSEGVSAFAERTVIVKKTPLLSLNMRADRDPIDPGAPLTYTLVFGNRGQLPALGVTLRALVPVGTSFQSADGGGTETGGVTPPKVIKLRRDEMFLFRGVSIRTGDSVEVLFTKNGASFRVSTRVGAPPTPERLDLLGGIGIPLKGPATVTISGRGLVAYEIQTL